MIEPSLTKRIIQTTPFTYPLTLTNSDGEAKISELNLPSSSNQNILGLNIPMHHAHFMTILNHHHYLLKYPSRQVFRTRPIPHPINQPPSGAQLHHKVPTIRILIHRFQSHNPRVPRHVLHYLHLAVHCLLPFLQRLARVLRAPRTCAANSHRPELPLPDRVPPCDVIVLDPLAPPHPRGVVNAPYLPFQSPWRSQKRRRAASGNRGHAVFPAPFVKPGTTLQRVMWLRNLRQVRPLAGLAFFSFLFHRIPWSHAENSRSCSSPKENTGIRKIKMIRWDAAREREIEVETLKLRDQRLG